MKLLRRIHDPVEGTARVVSSTEPIPGSTSCTCRLELVVEGPGVAPTAVEHKCAAPTDRWPYAGTALPVVFDRADPTRLEVRWKELPTARDLNRRRAEEVAAARRARAAPAAGPCAGAPQVIARAGADPAEQLANLERLHAAGKISDAQLEQARAQLGG